MEKIVTMVCFKGTNGHGIVVVPSANGVMAGDRVAGLCNVTDGDIPGGSAFFAPVIPADNKILQTQNEDLSAKLFTAIIVRDEPAA